jgi:hypothetical protein
VLLRGDKTNLVPVKIHDIDTQARLSLKQNEDGTYRIAINRLRVLDLDTEVLGVKFDDADKENLLKTGNLGRVVDLEHIKGVKTPSFVTLDKQTNELFFLNANKVKLPEKIADLQLSDEQRSALLQGKSTEIAGVEYQINAEKRKCEVLRDKDLKITQFRGVALDDKQQDALAEGKYVHVDGLIDRKGVKYSGYVQHDKTSGKIGFFKASDLARLERKGKVKPDRVHRDQVAAIQRLQKMKCL